MVSLHVQFLSNYCIGKNLPVPCLFYSPQIVIEIAHTDELSRTKV